MNREEFDWLKVLEQDELAEGRVKPACNQLRAFTQQVTDLARDGRIAPKIAAALLDTAGRAIAAACP